MASGNAGRLLEGFFQSIEGSSNHAQYSFSHDNWSRVDAKDIVSAERVLVTTFWIFLQPHDNGLMGQETFCDILLWVPNMILPACESGLDFEANDASENARKRKSSRDIGWIHSWTSWCLLPSCKTRFASISVSTWALLIFDCNMLRRLDKSGRVFTAAYWRLPIKARSSWRSESVTGSSGVDFLFMSMLMGLILRMYSLWERMIALSLRWLSWIPVNTNDPTFSEPKGYCWWSSWSFWRNTSSPPQSPSSTWIPMIPRGLCVLSSLSTTKTHGSKGAISKPNLISAVERVWYQRNGASMRPYALFTKRQISLSLSFISFANSGQGSNPIRRSSWGCPWRKAALISKLRRSQLFEAIIWSNNIRECLPNVGLSRGRSSKCGSRYPRTTSLALAFESFWGLLGSRSDISMGFHVNTQRHRNTSSTGIWLRNMRTTVPVFNQFLTSLIFAWRNSSASSLERSVSRTSDRCFFAAVATKLISEGSASDRHSWISLSPTVISNLQACGSASDVWLKGNFPWIGVSKWIGASKSDVYYS